MIEQLLQGGKGSKSPTPPKGTIQAGFYARESESQVISAADLATAIGLTLGTAFTGVSFGWFKMVHKDKVVYFANRAFRHSLSWDAIYNRGAVYDPMGTQGKPSTVVGRAQDAQVLINGKPHRVRLITATEWAELIIPLVDQWAPEYKGEMNIGNNTGSARWITDYGTNGVNSRQWRGWTSHTQTGSNPSNNTSNVNGWSPFLEPLS